MYFTFQIWEAWIKKIVSSLLSLTPPQTEAAPTAESDRPERTAMVHLPHFTNTALMTPSLSLFTY